MSDVLRQAGHFELKKFTITNFKKTKTAEISKIIYSFNITESVDKGAIRGSAILVDSYNLIHSFPLVGEEWIEITYDDFFGNERTEYMMLYSVTSTSYPEDGNSALTKYTIHFTSVGKFFSEFHRIEKTYKDGSIDQFVKQIYDQYYKNDAFVKPIITEKIPGNNRYVIPAYNPEQSILFLMKRAVSSHDDNIFRFFENRKMFFFGTNNELERLAKGGIGYDAIDPKLADAIGLKTKTIPVFRKNFAMSNTAERQYQLMFEIINIAYDREVNTIDDIISGAYHKKFYELDLLNGTVNPMPYQANNIETIHSPEMIELMAEKPLRNYVVKDYVTGASFPGIRSDQQYDVLFNNKKTELYHYNTSKFKMKIYGRNDLFAGDMIDLELYSQTPNSGNIIDPNRSGRFIVHSIENLFTENLYTQELTLARKISP